MEFDAILSLLAPYADAIKSDETGAMAEEAIVELQGIVDSDTADFLYDYWDAILAVL